MLGSLINKSIALQAAGGTAFVRKTMEAFAVATVKSLFLMDVSCYDGFPSLACVEDTATL